MHEKLLTHQSEFFRAALTGKFKEAEEKVVRLHDTEPEVFECVVHWLYYQRFPNKEDEESLLDIWGKEDDDDEITLSLIKMYVFGAQRMAPQLQRDALNQLFYHIENEVDPVGDHIAYAFNHLAADDPLCRFLVDTMIYYSNINEDIELYSMDGLNDWPPSYLLAYTRRATRIFGDVFWKGKKKSDFAPKLCDYHGHENAEERKECEHSRNMNKGNESNSS